MALPWAQIELPLLGAPEGAPVFRGFRKNAGRLIHRVAFANHPDNLNQWYEERKEPCPITFLGSVREERIWRLHALLLFNSAPQSSLQSRG